MDLQKRIDRYCEQGFVNFALQDTPGPLTKVSCGVFYPVNKEKAGWANNHDEVRRDLVKYVNKFPGEYILHYTRGHITNKQDRLSFPIDTRPIDEQTNQPNNLADMANNTDINREDMQRSEQRGAELGELRAEVKNLVKEIHRLEQENQDLVEQLEQEIAGNNHAQMADATTSTIGQVAQLIPTLLDKYFAIQEQKNALLAEQIRRQAPPQPQTNQNFEQTTNGTYYEREN